MSRGLLCDRKISNSAKVRSQLWYPATTRHNGAVIEAAAESHRYLVAGNNISGGQQHNAACGGGNRDELNHKLIHLSHFNDLHNYENKIDISTRDNL